MKIVYIAEREPVKKISRKDDLKQMAELLAARSENSLSSKRRSEKLYQAVLNEKATE